MAARVPGMMPGASAAAARRVLSAAASLAVGASLAVAAALAGPPVTAADGASDPESAVRGVLATLASGRYDALDTSLCDAQRDALTRRLDLRSVLAEVPAASRPAFARAISVTIAAPEASDREVKQAWRRLMSQYHPDKLIAEGMPEDMVRMATERTQEIQNAWEIVRKARGL